MATCLRGPPMSVAYTTPHLAKSQPSLRHRRRSVGVVLACLPSSSSNVRTPLLNPNDPFLAKVGFAAANMPEILLEYAESTGQGAPPFRDPESDPEMMDRPDAEGEPTRPRRKRRKDLATWLLSKRIVYIGMPLVIEVVELIVMQLMYLSWKDKGAPIFLYIDSTGTTREDGELVASEYQGFAVYDALMHMKNEIYTVGLGFAYGHACLLLAAGTKGKRYMFKHASAMLSEAKIVPVAYNQASDIIIRAKEAAYNRHQLVKLFAKHTGRPAKVVAQSMRRRHPMNVAEAITYGVCDKIYTPRKDRPLLMYKPQRPLTTAKPETLKTRDLGNWSFEKEAPEGQVSS